MTQAFSIRLPIRYEDSDHRGKIKPLALLAAMQEAAILHSESLGRGFTWLFSRDWAWMLVQTRIEMLDWPEWRQEITVRTWPSEMRLMLSVREFEVLVDDHLVARASTLWAFFDRQRVRVMRVPEEVSQAYVINPRRALDVKFVRPKGLDEQAAWVHRQTRHVRIGDIDSNQHANNLRVVDWLLNSLPDDHLATHQLQGLDIRYIAEMRQGQVIRLHHAAFNEGKHIHHWIERDDGHKAVAATSLWAPQPLPVGAAG